MAKIYKVWIEVEEIDEDEDHYERLDLPFSATGEFEDELKAHMFAARLHDFGIGA